MKWYKEKEAMSMGDEKLVQDHVQWWVPVIAVLYLQTVLISDIYLTA
jgi:hypothetical protein